MFDDSTPIFMQLADQLCAEIVAGTYPDGAKAPSINELAVFHRINPATANRAIALLVERGRPDQTPRDRNVRRRRRQAPPDRGAAPSPG